MKNAISDENLQGVVGGLDIVIDPSTIITNEYNVYTATVSDQKIVFTPNNNTPTNNNGIGKTEHMSGKIKVPDPRHWDD